MGKQGPCYHCGVTSTPLWRNGPPEKPILCNACGSRWRTKGTLTNYTPLHARAELVYSEDFKVSKLKSIAIKMKEQKFQKRRLYNDNAEVDGNAPNSDQNFQKVLEEDTSNRSSSGSAISYSESCAHYGSTDASDLTGSAQSNVWDVPSRKRTCVSRPKPSSVEKLTKDLYYILHDQQSSYLSGSSEEDLLFESETPMVSVEIGYGGVLIRHPNSVAQEEESEASSFSIDNKACVANDAYSVLMSHPVHTESKGTSIPIIGGEKVKKLTGQGAQEHMKRGKFSHDKFHILQNSNSPLGFIDLRDVVSFEEFMSSLTLEEQQQLMKYLPYTDTAKVPESLKGMFGSPQFVDNLLSFQQLLLEGIFDPSFSGADTEEYRVLKRLALVNLTKSKWVEHYQLLKDAKHKKVKDGKGVSNFAPAKRPCDGQYQNFPETEGILKSSKRMLKCGSVNLPSIDAGIKESHDTQNTEKDGSCFSPRSLFAFPVDRSSVMLDSLQFSDESCDQDLLFDVPSNASFPQAELLNFHPWKTLSLVESGIVGKEQTLQPPVFKFQQPTT